MIIVSAIVFASTAFAQGSVHDAPPLIDFPEWKSVDAAEGQAEYHLSFPSAIPSGIPVNDSVPIIAIVPANAKGPVPVVLVLHYWGASDLKTERSLANNLAREGIASILVTLPYHLARTPAGFRSGQLTIQPDTSKMIQTMRQSVSDVRRTVDWIESRPEFDHDKLGITGTSLGSLVSELVFALEPRVKSAAFVLGGADLAHILWHSSRVAEERKSLRRKGFTESRLRQELAEIEPLNHLPRKDNAQGFVVAGRFDTVIPPIDTQKLIGAIPDCKVLWLDTGHYGGIFVQGRVLHLVAEFFGKSLVGETFNPPSAIYAPTVRLGAAANPETGLQVALSLDVWRSKKQDWFASILATPRGPQAFVGYRLDKNIAIGPFATTRRFTFGAYWSTVL